MCQYCTIVFLVADYYNEMTNVVKLEKFLEKENVQLEIQSICIRVWRVFL